MSTFLPPPDIEQLTLARSAGINAIIDSVETAFNLLPSEDKINKGTVNYAVDTGSVNTYAVSISPTVITSYTDGLLVSFRPLNANTGSATLNVNGLGAKSIRLTGGELLDANDIVVGAPIDVRYSTATGFFHLTPNSAAKAKIATDAALQATVNGAEQVGLAAEQVGLATAQVGLAATQVGLAVAQVVIATTKAGEAATSATEAKAARDQAVANSYNGTYLRNVYTATTNQTVFSATYAVGFVDVYYNGVKLVSGTDFTATNGTSITLSTGAISGTIVEIIGYNTFMLSNMYTQVQVDSLIASKQDDLVSGTNIKTINSNSILGNGDLVISESTARLHAIALYF